MHKQDDQTQSPDPEGKLSTSPTTESVSELGMKTSQFFRFDGSDRSAKWSAVVSVVVAIVAVIISLSDYAVSKREHELNESQFLKDIDFHIQNTESAVAQTQYCEVRDILNNPTIGTQSQLFALKRFLDAYDARVNTVLGNDDRRHPPAGESNGTREKAVRRVAIKTTMPNCKPMRTLLQQFMRASRSSSPTSTNSEYGDIGTEVLKILQALGPGDPDHPDSSLWQPPHNLDTKNQKWIRDRKHTSQGSAVFDLAYLPPDFFAGASLPHLFANVSDAKIIFPEKTNFGSANLAGANLQNCVLRGATFRWCNLRGANLKGADLTGASFENAQLEGANFEGAVGYNNPTLPRQLEKKK